VRTNHSHIKGDAGLLGETDGGGGAGVGDWNYDVGIDGMLNRKAGAEVFSEAVDVLAEDGAVLLCKVNVLEEAVSRCDVAGLDEEPARQAVFVERDNFAGFDFANEFGVYCIKCAGLTCDDVTAGFGFSDAQRPDAVWVASGLDSVGEKKQQRKCALEVLEDVGEGVGLGHMGGLGQQVRDYLGIGGRFEYTAVCLVFVAQHCSVYEVAVMSDCDLASRVFDEERLAVGRLG